METMDWAREDGFSVSTDAARFDEAVFHRYLTEDSYWAKGRSARTTREAVANSLVFGLFDPADSMVGAARVVTDHSTFAWLCDVFVLERDRGKGLGKFLLSCVTSHPSVRDSRRTFLATADAHGMYRPFGFEVLTDPGRWMCRAGE